MTTEMSANAGPGGTDDVPLERGLDESRELSFQDALIEDIVTQRVGEGASPEQRGVARGEVLAREAEFLRRFAERIRRERPEEAKDRARAARVG